MTDKQKITTIYVSAAAISVLILLTTWFIQGTQLKPPPAPEPQYIVDEVSGPLLTLRNDLSLKHQDGRDIKISDLKGKVWAFAQFYATCPMCAKRNSQGLKALYDKYKGNPDFAVVCITVDPATDGVKEMKSYAEALGADDANWWFLTGDANALTDYMVSEMKYQAIVKRDDPDEAARLGAFEHDMSIAVFDRNLSMITRHDLYNARKKGDAFLRGEEGKLHASVQSLLENK
ncbi:MAG: SCO family protein [Akkermansiaceae bacterium]